MQSHRPFGLSLCNEFVLTAPFSSRKHTLVLLSLWFQFWAMSISFWGAYRWFIASPFPTEICSIWHTKVLSIVTLMWCHHREYDCPCPHPLTIFFSQSINHLATCPIIPTNKIIWDEHSNSHQTIILSFVLLSFCLTSSKYILLHPPPLPVTDWKKYGISRLWREIDLSL